MSPVATRNPASGAGRRRRRKVAAFDDDDFDGLHLFGGLEGFGSRDDDDYDREDDEAEFGDAGIDNPILSFVRLLWPVVFVLAILAGLFFVLYPAGRLVAQRDTLDARRATLAELEEANAALEDRLVELAMPREIERLARERDGAVWEDWEVYQMQPEPVAAEQLPDSWPFDQIAD